MAKKRTGTRTPPPSKAESKADTPPSKPDPDPAREADPDGEVGRPRGEICPVVGIGASAGGLEALQEFLGALGSETGMAYVVVQHLAPSHDSMLTEILSRSTSMPVHEAEQAMKVRPDNVYVIPPARDMTIADGGLRLTVRAKDGHRSLPVDHFFRALAEECASKAIGIVFSGTASDGVLGLKAIKSAGGITFAQDEKSAKYPEMPRSAVASGAVDFVLTPAGIARELARLRNHQYVLQMPRADGTVPPEDGPPLEEILQVLRQVTGADFTHYKQSTIRRRILRRMALARMERLADYVVHLKANRAEVEALYDDVLINVTSFFRDPTAFKALQKRVFPAMMRRRPADLRVRVWVPGCSTGEEVYSLAISFLEFLEDRGINCPVQIFGTDVSESIVERARIGRYSASIVADVSQDRLRRFFLRSADGFQVTKALRDVCVFAKHNLLKDPPFSKIDLVSCRNVLIYFGPVLQKRAISLFHYSVNAEGFLILGSSENIGAFTELFALVDKKHKIYTRRPVPTRLTFGPGSEDAGVPIPPEGTESKVAEARATDIQREADRIVMSRYVPAGVVVDDEMDILQFRGHTGPYLEPRSGSASLNLLKMAREGLVLELRSAFQRARRDGVPVKREGVRVKTGDRLADVDLEVVPFTSRQTRGRLYLVMFDPGPERRRSGGPKAKKPHAPPRRAGKTTEEELAATKDYLQTIIEEQEATNEELMSANEEILSSNEELQSTNEELETAKEELQSSNEELSTVNDELQSRNNELSDLNSDLKNLLGTIHIPMVVLDADLRVRRASPLGEKFLNLIPADVGRRVTDLRPNVEIPQLQQLVHDVIESMTPKDLEVRDVEGRWYAMHVRPYKTRDNRVEGVILTWVDIDAVRRIGRGGPRGAAATLLASIDRPAAILDATLRLVAANAAWRSTLGAPWAGGPLEWSDAPLVTALREVASGGPALPDRRVDLSGGAGHATTLSAAPVAGDAEGPHLLLVLRDGPTG